MEKQEFDSKFDQVVIQPLTNLGFNKSGNSIYFTEGDVNISLIRLGGRMSQPGAISHVLCFRHTFLPNLDEVVPNGFEREVFAYPIKLKPSAVIGLVGTIVKYRPKNLHYDYDRIEYSSKTEAQIDKDLEYLKKAIFKLLDWARTIEPQVLNQQIKLHGENAWIEQLWLKAYESKCIF